MQASGQGMHNLTTLLKRLEAATSRLEDIASSASSVQVGPSAVGGAVDTDSKSSSVDSASPVARSIPGPPAPTGPSTPAELPPSIQGFDSIVDEELSAFLSVAGKLGGVIEEQSKDFATAFKAQRGVILVASKAKEPDQTSAVYREVLGDIIKGIEAVHGIRDKHAGAAEKNHLAMLADGAGVLSWVTMKGSPDKYVAEVLGGAQMYGNRILSTFKGKDTPDIDWVKAFVKLCGALITYIKEYHAKGVQWNRNGISAEEALKQGEAPKANGPSGAAPPPPPPPPPPPQLDLPPPPPPPPSAKAPAGDMNAVFAELNKGEAVTSGLRKVDKSEMTHKNPALRAQPLERSDSSSSRGRSPQPPQKKQKPESMRTKKPSRKELDGNKWFVENYENESTPIEIDAEKHQSILVTKCKSVAVRVKGKVNAISIDNSTRVDLIADSLVSSVEVVNASNFRLQILGTLPSIQLDKVDNATIFLSKESLNAEIYTSNCTTINITLPPATEDEDSVEVPVPEQFKTTVVNGKLVSEIVKQEG